MKDSRNQKKIAGEIATRQFNQGLQDGKPTDERTRIVDIAEELGLSTATVSNVIHGKTKKISDETVKRVQELLEKRAYIPNMAGILLAQNNSRIIGVVINDHEKYEGHVLEDGFIASAINALSRELDKAGYFMMVKVTGDWNEIPRIASMWNMDGIVVIGFCGSDYRKLRASMHIPFVVYDGYFEESEGICNLVIDDYDGGYQVGKYLGSMGHKKILCIADNYTCMDKERIDGCYDGIGKTCHLDFLQIPFAKKERERFYLDHFSEIMEYSAVFAVSDFYAIELIQNLQKQGVRIPEDISVVGFDDSLLSRQMWPMLTTVKQDANARAESAIGILQEMKQGIYEKTTVKLPVQLVERDSVRQAEDNLVKKEAGSKYGKCRQVL